MKDKDAKTEPEPKKVEKDTGEPTFICVAKAGMIVPGPEGRSRTLKRGDTVTGEYYVEVARVLNGLVLESSLDAKFLAQLEKERKIRTGESFPETWKRAMEGVEPDDYDPRLDGGGVNAAENLSRVVQEQKGATRRAQ